MYFIGISGETLQNKEIYKKMKKILVCGGAGYIGSACSEYLLNMGYDVTIFDGLITGHRDAVDPRAKFILGKTMVLNAFALLLSFHNKYLNDVAEGATLAAS